MPEVAKRLGATRLLPNEATRADIVSASDAELRVAVGVYLQNCAFSRWGLSRETDTPLPGEILGHDVANGNPLAFAVDRIAPAPEPGADRDDWIARYVREISRCRGHEETPYWSLALQDEPDRAAAEPPEDAPEDEGCPGPRM